MTRRLRGEERGAVMMIVAISLIVLLGMLVLTFDLGHMISVRREMVRAADAAALAAAQECAMDPRPGAEARAMGAARQIATANHDGASVSSLTFAPSTECSSPTSSGAKLVTVKLTTSVDMFFAPIFGVGSSTVTAQATATWLSPGTVPVSVNTVPLDNCKLRPQENCRIEYRKDTLQEPRWGILDLAKWNVIQDHCSLSDSYIREIILSGGIWPLPEPVPAYDCIDNGAQFDSWTHLKGLTFWFPVIDVPNSLTENGLLFMNDPACAEPSGCNVTNAYVIDFVKMYVIDVSKDGSTIILDVKLIPSRGSMPGVEVRLVD